MEILKIGRSSDNNIIVNDAKVSRWHLQIVQNEDGKCYVVDLNSSNGTFVNGVRINGETHLHISDEIRIGDTILPWQNYITSHPGPQSPNPPDGPVPPSGGAHASGNFKQRLWFWVMVGVVFVLLLGSGGVVWKIYSDSKAEQEKFHSERQVDNYAIANSKKMESQALAEKQKAENAKNKAIAEKEYAVIVKMQAEKEKMQALAEKQTAEAAKKRALADKQTAVDAKERALAEKQAAEAAKKNALADKHKAEEARRKAEDEKRAIEKQLQESNKMMETWFKEIASKLTTPTAWLEIAKELGISDDVQGNEAKRKVEQEFKKKDSEGKMQIIKIMESVKNRPVNENNKHLEQQADTTATTKKQK